jgi:hypothetical protein
MHHRRNAGDGRGDRGNRGRLNQAGRLLQHFLRRHRLLPLLRPRCASTLLRGGCCHDWPP